MNFPIFGILLLQLIASSYVDFGTNSSVFYRIGISGNDIHNGGILGALQFLGGNRITLCLSNFSGNLSSMSLDTKIEIFGVRPDQTMEIWSQEENMGENLIQRMEWYGTDPRTALSDRVKIGIKAAESLFQR